MSKYLRVVVMLCFALTCVPSFAQEEANSLYEPVAVVQRLSYDNFKNIKLLTNAILNYGNEADFNRLVDEYSQASAYYFSRDYKKAADAFVKNEKSIREVATKLAEQYKKDAEALNLETINHNIRSRIQSSLEGKKSGDDNMAVEKSISQATEALNKANDSLVRAHPVQAVLMYRFAKQQMINYYEEKNIKVLPDGQKVEDRFAKEREDCKNKRYISKDKKN